MADTTDLLKQIISKLDEQGGEITAIRKEHGEKLDEQGRETKAIRKEHGEKLDHIASELGYVKSSLKALEATSKETREDVDKIKEKIRERERPPKVD